jgi:uncharacterized membrane-anchored protein
MQLTGLLRRVPRMTWFALAALLQIALIGYLVTDRASILRRGAEVTLEVRPVDPRDLLRGDYVILAYAISELPAGPLEGQPSGGRNAPVYVKLAPKGDGYFRALSVHAAPVALAAGEHMIQGRVSNGATCGREQRNFCGKLRVRYGIERYFVPQGEGLELEQARNLDRLAVVVALTPSGRPAIKRLLLDGKPVYEEPYF